MSNVISLTKPEPLIWVCACGCSTFKCYDTQQLECAQCGERASVGGEWVKEPVPARPKEPETVEHVSTISSKAEWTLRKLLQGDPAKLAIIIAIDESGQTVLWGSDCTSPERIEWLDRQLTTAKQILTKGAAGIK